MSSTESQTTSALDAVEVFTRLLRAHAMTARCIGAKLLAEHGLSLNDYEALYLLARADGRRLKRVELARRLVLTPSGVTRLLEGLEEPGLVERAECSSDLRVTYAQLTDAGLAALRAASCDHEGSIRVLLDEHLSPGEVQQLAELLGRLPGVLDDDAPPVPPRVRLPARPNAG